MNTQAEDKITKARIKLQGRSPFFSYLSFFLKFEEADAMIDGCFSMGVYPDGTVVYYPPWINKLTDEEMIGVLCHEIMHLALLHLVRRKAREQTKFNVACDIAINSMLLKNRFELPKDGILPVNDEWEIPKEWLTNIKNKNQITKIVNIGNKVAEEIYDELPDMPEYMKNYARGRSMQGDGGGAGSEGNVGGWDKHFEGNKSKNGKGDEEQGLGEAERNAIENEWLNRIEEAYVSAKQRGNIPLGLERYIDHLKKSQINWKTLLQKYILALMPADYTWARRSKKSMALDSYLPSIKKEKIDVAVGIDTSGSIGKEELTEFISEIIAMARAYKDRLGIRIMSHDVKVHTDDEVKNGNIDKIKKIKVKGGGGTSHGPIFDHVRDKIRDRRVFISFTDGYSDLDQIKLRSFPFTKIFVISKDGTDEQLKKQKGDCIIIKIK